MAIPEQSSPDHEQRLDEAVAGYLAAQAAGQVPDRQQWLAQFPDLADDLAEFWGDLDRMHRAVAPLREDAAAPSAADGETLSVAPAGSAPARADAVQGTTPPPRSPAERYRLERFHARGGMGEVWLAEDSQIGRRVALKKLRSEASGLQERFLLEAQITGQLEHPGIVPLHDLGIDNNGQPFYVMKFVQGRSFKEVIAAYHAAKAAVDWPRDVEFRRLLESFVSICHAVAYAHDKGVLHRDIKPDNIMLGSYGEALLLDWGLAKLLGQPDLPAESAIVPPKSGHSSVTQVGAVVGSPAYMSPELAEGRADAVDQRTDVYLLGATLYEMLTGRAPRAGGSHREIIDLARTTPPPPPRKIDARIPRPLEAICLRAMAHDQNDRYASAVCLAEDLERYLAGEPVSAYREPLRMRAWRWVRRHRRGLQRTLVGGLVLALAGWAYGEHQQALRLTERETAQTQLGEFRRLADESADQAARATDRGPDRETIARALEEYRQSLRLDPRHYWAQFQLARCYVSLERGPEAVQALGTCIALRPKAPWAYSTRGLAYGLLGQFADARADLDKALQLDPEFRPARLNLGFVYSLQNRQDEALAELDAVLQPPVERQLTEAAWYRAQIYCERREWAWALEDCAALLAQQPGFRPGYWLRTRVHLQMGHDAEGVQDLNTFLALAPGVSFHAESASAAVARGRALWKLAVGLEPPGRTRVLQRALAEFQTAIERGAPADDLEPDLQAVSQLLGQLQESVAALTQKLASSPDDLQARARRGWAYVDLKRYDLAAEDFQEMIRQKPQDAEAHGGLGFVRASQGSRAESEGAAAKATLYGANQYLALHNVACIYAELSRTGTERRRADEDLALTFLGRAVELFRQHPGGPDERVLIRQDPAFPAALRARAEFKQLLGESGKQAP